MKNNIQIGSEVIFRSYQYLFKGEVLKVNKKTFKIKQAHFNNIENIPSERVAHIDDVFTVVNDMTKDPNGQCTYFDYNNFPNDNLKATEWLSTKAKRKVI